MQLMALDTSGVTHRCRAALNAECVQQLSVLALDLLDSLIVGCVFSIIFQRRVKILVRRMNTILKILLYDLCTSLLPEAKKAKYIYILAGVLLLDF